MPPFRVVSLSVLCATAVVASPPDQPKSPVHFEQNIGQTDGRVDFLARSGGLTAYLTHGDAVLRFGQSAIRMRVGNGDVAPEPFGKLPGKINYLNGTLSRSGIGTWSGVRYRSVKPGIDVVYYGAGPTLEYDVEVAPHADPKAFRLELDGASDIRLGSAGELDVRVGGESLRFRRPVAYQLRNGTRTKVAASYVVSGKSVGFHTGAYDPSLPLIIDPVIVWSSYLGFPGAVSVSQDGLWSPLGYDSAGNLYMAGYVYTNAFPLTTGALALSASNPALFVTKLAASDRHVVYTTFVASGSTSGITMVVDPSGAVTLGRRGCIAASGGAFDGLANAPAPAPFQEQECSSIIRLDPSGQSISWSARVGFYLRSIHADSDGSIAVVGDTERYFARVTPVITFAATTGASQTQSGGGFDALAMKLSSAGKLLWATWLGGAGLERIGSAAFDAEGTLWLAGTTESADFPVTGPTLPTATSLACSPGCGFITGIAKSGVTRVSSRILPGFAPTTIVAPTSGRIIAGGMPSASYAVTWNALPVTATRGALVSLVGQGSTLEVASYLEEKPGHLLADSAGAIYALFNTGNTALPQQGGFQASLSGANDVYVEKFDAALSGRLWSSYFGGSGFEDVGGVAVFGSQLAISGATTSQDLPTTADAIQASMDTTANFYLAVLNTAANASCSSPVVGQLEASYSTSATTLTVPIATDAGCGWSASSDAAWATLSGGRSGVGAGTVRFAVAANVSSIQRTANLTIAGQKLSLNQAGVACYPYALNASSLNAGSAATGGSVQFTAPATDCTWTASSDSSWLTILTARSGTGSGSLNFSVGANAGAARTGIITVGNAQYIVSQSAGACASWSLSPTGSAGTAAGGGGNFSVAAPSSNCGWTAVSNADWITVTGGSTGTGSGTVTYTYSPNTGASRTGTITAAGQTFTLTQAAPACSVTLASSAKTFDQLGGRVDVALAANLSGCTWTATTAASFVTITPASGGTGSGSVSLSVAPNFTASARTAVIAIGDKQFTITQSAANCTYSLNPASLTPSASGQSGTVTITATGSNCAWTSQSDASWLQMFPVSGDAGSTPGTFTVFPNFGTLLRKATLRVGTTVLDVTQPGNSRNANERFVQLLYFNFFGRLPSEADLAFQTQALDTGTTRATMANSFFSSAEFNLGGRFVAGLYVGLLNRDAEYGGWLYQRNALATGLVDQTALLNNFLNSAEFQLQNGTLSNDAYVRLLYRQVLLREPSVAEVAFQSGVLAGGGSRITLASSFLNSQEFRISTGPRLTAFLLYACLLQRDATLGERTALVAQLNAGAPLLNLITDFVASTEFKAVFN